MQADGVSDAELRASYGGFQWAADHAAPANASVVQIADNEGVPPRSD